MKGVRFSTQGGVRFLVFGAVSALLFPVAVQALGFFFERHGPFPSARSVRDIAVGDVNGDGLDDVLMASGDRSFSIMLSQDGGELQDECIYSNGTVVYGLLPYDIDGNGLIDVITPERSASGVSFWLNHGDYDGEGCLEFEVQNKQTAPGPTEIDLGDFNNDGNVDLVVAADSHRVQVVLNEGYDEEGNWLGFGDIVQVGNLSFPREVFTGYFDDDDRLDFAVRSESVTKGLYIFWNDGIDCGQDQDCVWLGDRFKFGPIPTDSTADFFNDDELTDISIVQGSSVKTFLSNGDRTFSDNTRYYGIPFVHITSADFDDDGVADLATANGSDNTVSIILNTNNGVFSPDDMVVYPVRGDEPWVIRAGHVDSIPDLDVVTGNLASDDISVVVQLDIRTSLGELGPDD